MGSTTSVPELPQDGACCRRVCDVCGKSYCCRQKHGHDHHYCGWCIAIWSAKTWLQEHDNVEERTDMVAGEEWVVLKP